MVKETKITAVFFVALLGLLIQCDVGLADELHVPGQYPTIQAAINAANNGDTVIVADSTYTGDGNRDIYFGKAITIRSQNGPENCIIDCNGTESDHHLGFYGGTAASTLQGFTITNGYAECGAAICCGGSPTIINCIITGNTAERGGGAIFCGHSSSATITNCTIRGNSAEYGGAIFCEHNSSPTITNCTISDNSTKGDNWPSGGGGIYCSWSSITIINSQINHNLANGGGSGICCWRSGITIINSQINENSTNSSGGGIYCGEDSSLTIINCAISGNSAKGNSWSSGGGGIYCRDDSSLTIANCTISKNTAEGPASRGGGIYFRLRSSGYDGDTFTITNCTISGNLVRGHCHSSGGGIYCGTEGSHDSRGVFTITDCTISGNSARTEDSRSNSYGGGLYCDNINPMVIKCTISNNKAADGGGVACYQSNPIIAGCIISNNSPNNRNWYGGGGIYCYEHSSPTVTNCTIVGNTSFGIYCRDNNPIVTNSILYYNGNGCGDFIQIAADTARVTYSDIQDGWDGEGNIDADPSFLEPGYWDCNDKCWDCFWVEGDYHLLPGSLCINTGGSGYLLDNTDLDGRPRIIGSAIDMGVYEFYNTVPVADAGPNQTAYAWIDGIAKVTLDGTNSHDPDGDELTFLWGWTIDGNSFDVNGVSPTIELPVGKHTIRLIVNDGIEGSEPDEVTITVIEPMESRLWIFPQVINRHSRMKKIMAWVHLPEGVTKDQVDSDEPLLLYPGEIEALLYPGEIEATRQYVFRHGRRRPKRTSIFAFFDKAELMDAIPDNGRVELQVVGNLTTGQYFYGSDTVRIITRPHR